MLGPEVAFVDRDYIIFEGRKYLYFGGTDYHRLSTNPTIIHEVARASAEYGISATGSRTTTGNHRLYGELEQCIAGFFKTESAIVFSNGYLSNTIMLEGIQDKIDRIFIDEDAHSSLLMAVRLSGKPFYSFNHTDVDDLESKIKNELKPKEIPIVATDGVFAAKGEIPPLKEYEKLIEKYNGKLLLDDAHAMATVGPTGKGSWEYENVKRKNIHQTGTLSKGFGVFGGVITDSKDSIEKIKAHSSAFCGSTSIPLPIVSAAKISLSILLEKPRLISKLQQRALTFKRKLQKVGFELPVSPSPIISVTHFDEKKNKVLEKRLLENYIYSPFMDYPGSPKGGHFRFALTSNHTDEQIQLLYNIIVSTV